LNAYFLQDSVAPDLMGGVSFNAGFLHRSFKNLTVKNMKICSLLLKLS